MCLLATRSLWTSVLARILLILLIAPTRLKLRWQAATAKHHHQGRRYVWTLQARHAPHETMPCESFQDYGIFYLAAALYGFGDCTVTTVTATICTTSFAATGQTADAWALFRSFLGFGALICFSVSPMLGINGGTTSTYEHHLLRCYHCIAVCCAAVWLHLHFFNYTKKARARTHTNTCARTCARTRTHLCCPFYVAYVC